MKTLAIKDKDGKNNLLICTNDVSVRTNRTELRRLNVNSWGGKLSKFSTSVFLPQKMFAMAKIMEKEQAKRNKIVLFFIVMYFFNIECYNKLEFNK